MVDYFQPNWYFSHYLLLTLQITMYKKLKIEKFAHENVKKVGFSVIALTAQLAQTANSKLHVFLKCDLWTNCL